MTVSSRSKESSVTRAIELTPVGRAAVAVVLATGPDAVRIVGECFVPAGKRKFADTPVGRIVVGHWGTTAGEEVVVCRRATDAVEIHCHGGIAAVGAVMTRLRECGCQSATWQDWLRESAGDPIRAAALVALAEAPTARTAAILLDQFDGALSAACCSVMAAVDSGDWQSAARTLNAVIANRDLGIHLTRPWRVVLAGPPNVGKSSLMNALVGFQRAIVCDLPGTTRDVVTASTAIDGWPVQLADTAGLRETSDALETMGVERAQQSLADADLVVLVSDSPNGGNIALAENIRTIRVLNKIDLLNVRPGASERNWDVMTSAIMGAGIEDLIRAIAGALVPIPPAPGAGVPFTAELVSCCEDASAAVSRRDAARVAECLWSLMG